MFADIVLFDGEKFELGFERVYKAVLLRNLKESKKGLAVYECDEFSLQSVLESRKAAIVLISEKVSKDHLHFRRTALNHVMCKLAKKNDVAIAFSLSAILEARDRPLLLGRIMQSIRLCRKYKVDMLFASFARDKFGMRAADSMLAFAQVLGMTAGEARKALTIANSIALRKKPAAKGVKIVD